MNRLIDMIEMVSALLLVFVAIAMLLLLARIVLMLIRVKVMLAEANKLLVAVRAWTIKHEMTTTALSDTVKQAVAAIPGSADGSESQIPKEIHRGDSGIIR